MTLRPHLRRAALAVLLGLAATTAMSNSFMLAPGMPSFEELGHRNVEAHRHLASILKGADLAAFKQRESDLLKNEVPRLTEPRSDVSRYSDMWNRWTELEQLLNKHDPAFLKDLVTTPHKAP